MCRGWQEGDHETREYPGMTRGPLYIDQCVTPILDALNTAGIRTIASCCGHGVRPGAIVLADGREFIIAPDYDTARTVERAFLPVSGQPDLLPGLREALHIATLYEQGGRIGSDSQRAAKSICECIQERISGD